MRARSGGHAPPSFYKLLGSCEVICLAVAVDGRSKLTKTRRTIRG